MIATFLRQELDSPRFADTLHTLIARENIPLAIVAAPDLTDLAGNTQRRRLLTLHRGYDTRDGQYLSGFPTTGVEWAWWDLAPEEVLAIRYIDWDYWLELTGGSRRPTDAARRILEGVRVYDVSNEGVLAAAAALRAGARFPELILVRAGAEAPLVVLEGHARLTAYALAPEAFPRELSVLIGTSPAIAQWGCY